MNSFQPDRDEKLAMHPTVKPVAMVADAILDCSKRKGIILDPFAGSGTTILAAQRTGRRCYALELDPRYVDVALRRVRSVTGVEPVCAKTGREFGSLEAAGLADHEKSSANCEGKINLNGGRFRDALNEARLAQSGSSIAAPIGRDGRKADLRWSVRSLLCNLM